MGRSVASVSICVAIALIVALASPATAAPAADDKVTVSQGVLQGVAAAGVTAFKNIPYAAPPVGDLRWRPPRPGPAWSGVRKADVYGLACTQPAAMLAGAPSGEDCLSLNIWTPANRPAGARLPVMVWIHGGAFVEGTASSPFYDGTHFAQGGVVLVTLNYRLGRFGFFAHPALTAADPEGPLGNYGLMDQIAALKWVQANIAAFGGDPDKVTIFGESAGAISVNYLMASPLARGLFSRAISESGFGRLGAPPIRGGPSSAEAVGLKVAASLGITGDGAAALAALRALPADKLIAAPKGLADPAIPTPMIDGLIAPRPFAATFAAGLQAKVPYIAGGNSWEASLVPAIRTDPERVLSRTGPFRDTIINLYGGPSDLSKVAMDLFTDKEITEPNRFLARQMVKAGQPAWVYFFSYVPAAKRASLPGACHGCEIIYVFDNLFDHPTKFGSYTVAAATPEDRGIGDAMHAYWLAFAKAGDPDSAGGVAWPVFDAASQSVLEFGPDGVGVRPRFRKARLDALSLASGE